MCGICGLAGLGRAEDVRRMAAQLVHRGPDEEGFFESRDPTVHLGNRRLSVLDVAGGRQPIANEDGTVVAVQNGEIYNFRELRAELEQRGHVFRTQTDTEVLPHLYEEHGDDFVRRLEGMFAVAIWDVRRRRLVLARDPIGVKPLYLWQRGHQLAFASEIKAFLPLPGFEPVMDVASLHFLLNVRFIPGTRTLFRGVRKLPPGGRLVWDDQGVREDRYWELDVSPDRTIRRPEDAVAETQRLLERAVRAQLVSDVPLGLYLSGGIDSSALVAMAARAGGRVRTFTLGFGEPTDELEDARLVAEAFGTEHHEQTIEVNALSHLPDVTWHVEEPKENAIQLLAVARGARPHVKVALSGLGGDELFGGYRLFEHLRPLVPAHRLIGRRVNETLLWPLRNLLAVMTGTLGAMRFDLARRALDFALSVGVPERSYVLLRNSWEHDRRLFESIYSPAARRLIEPSVEEFFAPHFEGSSRDVREAVLRAEFHFKMVDDFLMNEDRTSMASSLEVRVPFLDRTLVEFAFSIPAQVKFARGLKTVLRQAMVGVLPERTLAKPKWGFTFDSYHQFQKDLRGLARRDLTPRFLAEQGLFQHRFVTEVLEHPPHRWMRWHYFLLWLMLGVKVWEDLFVRGQDLEECRDAFR